MHKYKLIWVIICTFTVLGGLLAFKSRSFYGTYLLTGTTSTRCAVLVLNITSTDDDTKPSTYVTTDVYNTSVCVLTYTKFNQ